VMVTVTGFFMAESSANERAKATNTSRRPAPRSRHDEFFQRGPGVARA
jgi:hypothetical protein